MNKKIILFFWAIIILISCDSSPRSTKTGNSSLNPYNPTAGGWTLEEKNDFSTSLTNGNISISSTEGTAVASVESGRLKYVGDSTPDDKVWIRTGYGFVNSAKDYKIYIEPVSQLSAIIANGQTISFHLWDSNTPAQLLIAELSNGKIYVYTYVIASSTGTPIGEAALPSGLDFSKQAFEMIIEGSNLLIRLINLETSAVAVSVTGSINRANYVDNRDIRLRLHGIGTIYADNFRIYTK